jgi:hypothetical protein
MEMSRPGAAGSREPEGVSSIEHEPAGLWLKVDLIPRLPVLLGLSGDLQARIQCAEVRKENGSPVFES